MTFSVIIPVYNVAPYLRECLDSLLAQTYTDWAAICVDDGSTDGSGVILDEYAAKDSRFTVIRQANAGVGAARNVALESAHGEYLVYVDADDYVDEDYLEEIAEMAERNNRPDVIRLGGFKAVDNGGSVVVSRTKTTTGGNAFEQLCAGIIANASLWLCVCRREPFATTRFPVGVRYGEDDVYLMRLLSKVRTFVQTDINGYHYRYLREGAASRVLTCHDIALLFSGLQSVLPGLLAAGRGKKALLAFHHAYIRKNIFRAARKSSRFGSSELCQSLRENSREFGIYDESWRWGERLRAAFFVRTGSWVLYDLLALLARVMRMTLGRVSALKKKSDNHLPPGAKT